MICLQYVDELDLRRGPIVGIERLGGVASGFMVDIVKTLLSIQASEDSVVKNHCDAVVVTHESAGNDNRCWLVLLPLHQG